MPTDEKPSLQKRLSDTPDEIRELFVRCGQRQKAVSNASFEKMRELLIQEITFARFPFPRRPEGGVPVVEALSWCGYQYQTLVELLKTAPNDFTLWYWLAQWFKSEGIREPDRFLSKEAYRELTKDARRQLAGFFGAAYYNSYLVRLWLSYTEPLLRKAKWLRQRKPPYNVKRKLQDLGFDREVLEVLEGQSRDWRSAVEFTCAWVAKKGGADAETLRNAYSQVFGQRTLSGVRCSFCEKPAENEFWAYSDPIPHCKEHGADQLPTTENSARTDRFGRRWWRQDLEICNIMPAV
jgi:hypothetical protein